MATTTDHGLICPSEDDYGATALFMQQNALQAEAALLDQRSKLNAYVNRPAVYFTSTATSSFASAGGEVMPDGRDGNQVSFAGGTISGGGVTVASPPGGLIALLLPTAGWYDIGGYFNCIPAGAVNVGSERVLYVSVFQTNADNPALNPRTIFEIRTTETNTGGGEFLNTSGLIYLNSSTTASIGLYESHQNTSSNLVIQTGAKLWLSFMGPRGALVNA